MQIPDETCLQVLPQVHQGSINPWLCSNYLDLSVIYTIEHTLIRVLTCVLRKMYVSYLCVYLNMEHRSPRLCVGDTSVVYAENRATVEHWC